MTRRGVTLLELLLAVTLGFVILLAIGNLDVTRMRLTQDVAGTGAFQASAERVLFHMAKRLEQADRINLLCTGGSPNGPSPACVGAETNIQIRFPDPKATNCPSVAPPSCPAVCVGCGGPVPEPCCFDIPTNAHWVEYRYDPVAKAVRFFDDSNYDPNGGPYDCTSVKVIGQGMDGLVLTYQDVTIAPAGGGGSEPFTGGEDNNTMQIELTGSADPTTSQPRSASLQVTIRASAYTDVNASSGAAGDDSGTGLQAPGLGDINPPPAPCP